MDLFLFYISQIFQDGHLPMPDEVCAAADTIKTMCETTISFLLMYSIATFLLVGFLLVKKVYRTKNIILWALSFLSIFFFADYSMKQIQDPSQYGVEWFTLSYYLWAYIITCLFFCGLLFPQKRRKLIKSGLLLTLAAIFIFAYTGRGNFVQDTPIAGGLFAGITFRLLWLSFSFRLFCFMIAFFVLFSVLEFIVNWTISGGISLRPAIKKLTLIPLFFVILLLPVTSIFLGEMLADNDAKTAKNYIDNVKGKVDKYFYENGEYPKFVDKMIPEGRSPRLLERHEFFTYGIKGTYYFSRADKYCFIFQNPTRKFGYYSITNERGWRYNESAGSYDDVFINLCDESNKSFEDLISSHLGVDNPEDKMVNEISAAVGASVVPALSSKAGQIIEEKLKEEGAKDPSLMKYFSQPQEDKK